MKTCTICHSENANRSHCETSHRASYAQKATSAGKGVGQNLAALPVGFKNGTATAPKSGVLFQRGDTELLFYPGISLPAITKTFRESLPWAFVS